MQINFEYFVQHNQMKLGIIDKIQKKKKKTKKKKKCENYFFFHCLINYCNLCVTKVV